MEGVQKSGDNIEEKIAFPSMIEAANNGFSIYPNPSQGVFTIHFEEQLPNTTLQIFDVVGKLRKSISTNHSIQTIDASDLENGVYIIVISDGEQLFKEKIVISK